MKLKYDIEFSKDDIILELKKITNQIYKLLPNREEGIEWQMPLQTIIEQIAGMNRLITGHEYILFPLLCKLEGLFTLINEEDFFAYRRTIFECLSLVNNLIKECQD